MNKIIKVLRNPWRVFNFFANRGLADSMSDERFLKLQFRANTGRRLNLDKPRLFNEKLQWLKLHDRNPMYTIMADKVKAKDYVADKIGREYVIPTLGVWDNADDVDFSSLPDRFVIKCNHNSGKGMYICRDKSRMDERKVRDELRKGLSDDYYKHCREWPYKNIPRRILAEQYMEDGRGYELKDYKFFCFNGQPRLCQVISDRTTDERIDFYDMEWRRLVGLVGLVGLAEGVRNGVHDIPCPRSFDDMKRFACVLSADIPFSRIDFYDINGHAYWGEITFFPAGGVGWFEPDGWNEKVGSWVKLPNKL